MPIAFDNTIVIEDGIAYHVVNGGKRREVIMYATRCAEKDTFHKETDHTALMNSTIIATRDSPDDCCPFVKVLYKHMENAVALEDHFANDPRFNARMVQNLDGELSYIGYVLDGEDYIQHSIDCGIYSIPKNAGTSSLTSVEKHGLIETHHKNGRVSTSALYSHGKLHGVYDTFDSNGKMLIHSNYSDGELCGIYRKFVNGVRVMHLNYVNGNPDLNEITITAPNKIKIVEIFIKENISHAVNSQWSNDGKLRYNRRKHRGSTDIVEVWSADSVYPALTLYCEGPLEENTVKQIKEHFPYFLTVGDMRVICDLF